MSGIRRRNSRQSDVPAEERPSQRQRRATSPNYELPHDEAMETIDRLVQDEETNSGDGAIVEKIPTLQSMAIQPVVPTRLPRPPTINFEELSLLTRDEVFPHLKFDHLKTEGILFIDGSVFARDAAGPQGQLPINVSREGLKEYLVFLGSGDSSRVGWFIDQLVFFSSQGHEDGKLLDLRAKLVIRQVLKWIGRPSSSYTSTTLVLLALAEVDPREPNLKPDWCELIRERDHLKEDLHKAQDILADAAQREEALRAEHQKLQEEYS
ncbi:hypothetical protein R1flu_022969 [Riccia fluitans]|uniref:Uncharacterized protein n=1 Tax=Riccia fluitans TaxID=41844 RepID=A0ABD1XQT8_9MARC